MLTGDSGIIKQASDAKEETRGATVEEARDIWRQEKENSKLFGNTNIVKTVEEFVESLGPAGRNLLTQDEIDQIIGNQEKGIEATWKVTIGTRTINFAKTLVEAFKDGEIKIGDYLDYRPVEGTTLASPLVKEDTGYDGEQNFTVDMNTTWRVLGLSEDEGNLLLTSGNAIKRDGDNLGLALGGAEGYINCVDVLNEICNIYINDFAEEVRSLNVEDLNRILGVVVDEEKNALYKITDTAKENPLPDYLGYFGASYEYKRGEYAPENYVRDVYPENEKYQMLTPKKVGDTLQGTAFQYMLTSDMIEQGEVLCDLLSGWCWLSSTGIHDRGYGIEFCPSAIISENSGIAIAKGDLGDNPVFDNDGLWVLWQLGVRPIITLKSNVTIYDIELTTKTEVTEDVYYGVPDYGILSGEDGLVDENIGTFTLKVAQTNEVIGTVEFSVGDTWEDFIGSGVTVNGIEFTLNNHYNGRNQMFKF